MSYFNKSVLANGLNKYKNNFCSWVLIGDNKYISSNTEGVGGFFIDGAEQTDKTTITSSINFNNSSISDFKDINIAAITQAVSVSDAIGYSYNSENNLEINEATAKFMGNTELKINVKSTTTTASSDSNKSCFAFPGVSTNNFNDSGFELKQIWLIIWKSNCVNTSGGFPSNFINLKSLYGANVEEIGSKCYFNGTTNGFNLNSNLIVSDTNTELILFGTDVTSNSTLFNDYNYTSFSVGSLTITLQGLSTSN